MQADFYPQLQAFLATPAGTRFEGDFAFVDGSDEILAVRSTFRWLYFESAVDQVRIREIIPR